MLRKGERAEADHGGNSGEEHGHPYQSQRAVEFVHVPLISPDDIEGVIRAHADDDYRDHDGRDAGMLAHELQGAERADKREQGRGHRDKGETDIQEVEERDRDRDRPDYGPHLEKAAQEDGPQPLAEQARIEQPCKPG